MKYSSFISETVLSLNAELLNGLREIIIPGYLTLSLVKKEEMTAPMLAEKLCDYFEKVNLTTKRSFEKTVLKYTSDLDSVVKNRIEEKPKEKKNIKSLPTPRARLYYEKCDGLRTSCKSSVSALLDYTRIMLCLYTAYNSSRYCEIDNFDLSMSKLNLPKILKALHNESNWHGKPKFELTDPYTSDRSTFIFLIIMFYYMKSKEIKGEY